MVKYLHKNFLHLESCSILKQKSDYFYTGKDATSKKYSIVTVVFSIKKFKIGL